MCLSFLFIGLGSISGRHRSILKQLFPNCTIDAIPASGVVLGRNAENVDNLYADYEILDQKKYDIAFVCSPATRHIEDLEKLSGHIQHVFLEKPVISDDQLKNPSLKKIISCFDQIDVGYCLRFNSGLQTFKELANSKITGPLYNISATVGHDLRQWRPFKNVEDTVTYNKELGGGVLLELSHELDYLLWIFGAIDIKSAILRTVPQVAPSIESVACILAETADGCPININLDLISPYARRYCEISGRDGTLNWDYVSGKVTFTTSKGSQTLFSDANASKSMYLKQIQNILNIEHCYRSMAANWCDGIAAVKLISRIREVSL
jgi:predicted dehydrogenase